MKQNLEAEYENRFHNLGPFVQSGVSLMKWLIKVMLNLIVLIPSVVLILSVILQIIRWEI